MTVGLMQVGASASYDNVNNWPYIASFGFSGGIPNRPVYNSGTSTLSWIGPQYGGPSTTSDLVQSLVLTSSGKVTSSSNGGTPVFTGSSASIAMTNTFAAGNKVIFGVTGGALPANLVAGLGYFVLSSGLSGSGFEISLTSGGAAITISDAGSGAMTCGQLIEGLAISAGASGPAVNVSHNGVTVRRCYLAVSGFPGLAVGLNATTITGTLVEDCEEYGGNDASTNYANAQISGVAALTQFLTVRRCNIHGFEKFLGGQEQQNNLYIDNVLWQPSGGDADGVPCWFASNHVTVEHNYIYNTGGSDASFDTLINITNYDGNPTIGGTDPLTDINFTGNAMNGTQISGHWVIAQDYQGGTAAVASNIQITNNGFIGNHGQTPSGGVAAGVTANSGNFVMATALATSGSLVNGTGTL